jgi:cyclopropane fatty-acyl-phospholipid synthase-like methyltransferase
MRVGRFVGKLRSRWPALVRAGAWRRDMSRYERLAEYHAAACPDDTAVGAGDFEKLGRIELALLRQAGLGPGDTLIDYGCGVGRLAIHAIPYLTSGHYVGVDISRTMIKRARRRIAAAIPRPSARVTLIATDRLPAVGANMICAFSVFTHMEHEDAYRVLRSAREVVAPGGKFVFSCWPITHPAAQEYFREQAAHTLDRRWAHQRNVVTSREFMEAIVTMSGWAVEQWYRGDEPGVELGQSTAVLR